MGAKRLPLLVVPVLVFAGYIALAQLRATRHEGPTVDELYSDATVAWAHSFLAKQARYADAPTVPQCNPSLLKMPIRVQQVFAGNRMPMKMFLHTPNVDVHISEPQWNQGTPGHWSFEADYHQEFMVSIDKLQSRRFMKQLTILDIGANIGVHSLFFALQNTRVHSFEPSKSNFQLLQCSAFINGLKNIVLNNVALSKETTSGDGWCITTPDNENQGHKVLTKDCKNTTALDGSDNSDGIRTITLDDYWIRVLKKKRVDMVKIDIEGHEPLAFAGAQKMLKEAPPYVIYSEFQPLPAHNNGYDPIEFIKMMWGFGYKVEVTRNDFGFKNRNIDTVEIAKELVEYVDMLDKQYGVFLLDLVFKHKDFL